MPAARAGSRSAWRYMPLGLVLALFIVVAVNGVMVYDALSTFPGEAGANAFDLSNHYDAVLTAKAKQDALGWKVDIRLQEGHPVVHAVGADGAPLAGLTLAGTAERPVGPAHATPLHFAAAAAGDYVAAQPLDSPGQWDVSLAVSGADGARYHLTRRVVLR